MAYESYTRMRLHNNPPEIIEFPLGFGLSFLRIRPSKDFRQVSGTGSYAVQCHLNVLNVLRNYFCR